MSDNVLREATLDELQGRPWSTVAPLLAPPADAGAAATCPCVKHRASSGESQGQIALVPHRDRSWDVLAGFDRRRGVQEARDVPFAQLPQAIADLAARCEAAQKGEGEGGR